MTWTVRTEPFRRHGMRSSAGTGFCIAPATMQSRSVLGRTVFHRALSEFFVSPTLARQTRHRPYGPRSLSMIAGSSRGDGTDSSSLDRLRAMQRDIVRRRRRNAQTGRNVSTSAAEVVVPKPAHSVRSPDSAPPSRGNPAVDVSRAEGDAATSRMAGRNPARASESRPPINVIGPRKSASVPAIPHLAGDSEAPRSRPVKAVARSINAAHDPLSASPKPILPTPRTREDAALPKNALRNSPKATKHSAFHNSTSNTKVSRPDSSRPGKSHPAPAVATAQSSDDLLSEDARKVSGRADLGSASLHVEPREASTSFAPRGVSPRTSDTSLTTLNTGSSPHRSHTRGFSSKSSSDPSSGGHWLERVIRRLPFVADTSRETADNALNDERVWIPTLEEAMGLTASKALPRRSGDLPRLSAAMARQAAEATAKSLEERTDSSQESHLGSASRSRLLESLNEPQRRAVVADLGKPCLVLAGPGSGKTRVLSYRVAYLVQELGVSPHQVMAVTFTNKAAGEMKERIDKLLTTGSHVHEMSRDMLVGTFHSICARLLRMHGTGIDIMQDFDIADQADVRSVVSGILKEKLGDECKADVVSDYVRKISKVKNGRGEELQRSVPDMHKRAVEVMKLYNDKMRSMNKLDFDDLLVETNRLLDKCVDVRRLLQTRYQHVLVDEWQDTNSLQYEIISTLSASHRNLFVVGDADQSIYKFRGADSRNMDRFSQDFEDAESVALVENYRSTQCIVQAAQGVIQKNKKRPDKKMITSNRFGDPVDVIMCEDARDEASTVIKGIQTAVRSSPGVGYSDAAILYRTNAQSRLFEEACVKKSIPYRLVGGLRFYERAEIKDLLAYLRLLRNPLDDTSLKRAINTPPRGIGKKTVEALEDFAVDQGMSMMSALDYLMGDEYEDGDGYGLMKGASKKRLGEFHSVIESLRESCSQPVVSEVREGRYSVDETVSSLIELVNFKDYSDKIGGSAAGAEKAEERWRNVTELVSAAKNYSSLDTFLESVALVSDVNSETDASGNVRQPQVLSLMTLHGGKGLEFDHVFITGMEEGLMPMIFRDEIDKQDALEEERRLAYVGMTRARSYLHLSWRRRKLLIRGPGKSAFVDSKRSRFLDDLPAHLINDDSTAAAKSNLYRFSANGRDALGRDCKSRGTTVFKSAKNKSVLTSYSSSGAARKLASSVEKDADDTPFNVGDHVRESSGLHGVVVAAKRDSPNVDVIFSNGVQRSMAKSACTRVYAV